MIMHTQSMAGLDGTWVHLHFEILKTISIREFGITELEEIRIIKSERLGKTNPMLITSRCLNKLILIFKKPQR